MTESSKRFVDYFIVCGVGSHLKPLAKDEKWEKPFAMTFQAEILDRYPFTDHTDAPLSQQIWMFCYPSGLKLVTDPPNPQFFTFALTELGIPHSENIFNFVDGTRFYGAALTVYESLSSETLTNLSNDRPETLSTMKRSLVYSPVCLCILSHHPFYSVYREYLREIYKRYRLSGQHPLASIPLERMISNLVCDIPLPPRGKIKLNLSVGTKTVTCMRPSPRQFNMADFSFKFIFEAIGVHNVVTLFGCLLREFKVVFVASQYTLLTIAAESITALMYPFYWHHVFIPILPCTLRDFLQAPTPFIIGMHSSYFNEHDASEVVVVDLDAGNVTVPSGPLYALDSLLPTEERIQLISRLKKLLHPEILNLDNAFPEGLYTDEFTATKSLDMPITPRTSLLSRPSKKEENLPPAPRPADGSLIKGIQLKNRNQELEIRCIFLEFFVSFFGSYRKYITYLRRFPEPIAIFNKAQFLKEKPQAVAFLSHFLETQAFVYFLEKHHLLPDNIFDDAITHRKSNPDVYTLPNHKTSMETITVAGPDTSDLKIKTFEYQSRFPRLRAELFPPYAEAVAPWEEETYLPKRDRNLHEKEGPKAISDRDQVTEDFLKMAVNKVIVDGKLSNSEFDLCRDLFKLANGRLIFAKTLESSKSAGPCISDSSFFLLADLITTILAECESKADFTSPRILMNPISMFYHHVSGIPEFLHQQVRNMDIWKNDHYWEAAFFESVAEARKELPSNIRDGLIYFEKASQQDRQEIISKEETVIFTTLGSFAYNMLHLSVTLNDCRHFISRMSALGDLHEPHTTTLYELLKNIERVNNLSAAQIETLKTPKNPLTTKKKLRTSQPDYFISSLPNDTEAERMESIALYSRLLDFKSKYLQDKGVVTLETKDVPLPKDSPQAASPISVAPKVSVVSEKRPRYTIRTLTGHRRSIECLQVHKELSKIISGGSDGCIFVWELESGGCLNSLLGHEDKVSCLDMDETNIVSGSYDKSIRVWDTNEGTCKYKLAKHTAAVSCLQLQGTTILSGSFDNTLKRKLFKNVLLTSREVWDTRTGKTEGSLSGHSAPIMCVQIEQSMNTIVSGSRDNTIRVWDIRVNKVRNVLREHTDWVRRIKFDSDKIVSGSYDCTVKVWNAKTSDVDSVRTFSGHRGAINCFQYDDNKLISGSGDKKIKVWDMKTGICKKTLKGHTDEVMCMEYVGDHLATGSFDQTVRVWDLRSGDCVETLRGHSDWVYAVQFDGSTIVSGSWDSTVKIWQLDPEFSPKRPLSSLRRRNTTDSLTRPPPEIPRTEAPKKRNLARTLMFE